MKTVGMGRLALVLMAGIGCSPAADPIAKGRMVFNVDFPDRALGKNCELTDVGGVGDPPPDLANPDNTIDAGGLGKPVVDGQSVSDSDSGEYEVTCTVTKSGSMDISIVGPNHNTTTLSPTSRGEAGISVYGNLSTSDGTGRGDITVRTVNTGSMASQGTSSCILTALNDKNGNPAVGAGAAAFVFECAQAVTSRSQFGVCATRGTVIVEDCIEK